ncbi:hypothetical protein GJAV_G00053730 [Gymnothorax javanicus]|nr:hypothetical protein GJAV_G00053730 [Gymnothorax javanicus]
MTAWFRRVLKRPESDTLYPSFVKNQVRSCSTPESHVSISSHIRTSCKSISPRPPLPQDGVIRWSRSFDVCLCHSAMDIVDAQLIASRLEAGPHRLRCFLPLRDSTPGGTVSAELCEAVQGSHCWVLLITPAFLVDPWCQYLMNQVLAEAPMSNRIIPLLLRVSRSDYPPELSFYYYIDLTKDPEQGYARLHRTVMNCLEKLCKSASEVDCAPVFASPAEA